MSRQAERALRPGRLDLETLFTRLVRVQTELWNAVDHRVRTAHDVALTDATALRVVAETPGCRVQDLVSTLHITVGGASKVVDRLVGAGYVVRKANVADRRSSVLVPTRAGRALLARVSRTMREVLEQRLGSRLSADDLVVLDGLLTSLQTSVPSTGKAV